MRWAERIDLFRESLPHDCLYCEMGYPVVFGVDSFLDCFACGRHALENVKSKKVTLKLTRTRHTDKTSIYPMYAPLVGPGDCCEHFSPVRFKSRKFGLLNMFGYFDDMEEK